MKTIWTNSWLTRQRLRGLNALFLATLWASGGVVIHGILLESSGLSSAKAAVFALVIWCWLIPVVVPLLLRPSPTRRRRYKWLSHFADSTGKVSALVLGASASVAFWNSDVLWACLPWFLGLAVAAAGVTMVLRTCRIPISICVLTLALGLSLACATPLWSNNLVSSGGGAMEAILVWVNPALSGASEVAGENLLRATTLYDATLLTDAPDSAFMSLYDLWTVALFPWLLYSLVITSVYQWRGLRDAARQREATNSGGLVGQGN